MSGVHIELTQDTATPAIRNAILGLEGDGLQLMLDDIGEYVVRTTRERAELEIDPDGNPWDPLSPRYERRKQKKRPGKPILKFDSHMLGDQFSHQVVGDTVFVGTNAVYGAAHQFGHDGIPAREWLGLSEDDEAEVIAIAADHVSGMFSG